MMQDTRTILESELEEIESQMCIECRREGE